MLGRMRRRPMRRWISMPSTRWPFAEGTRNSDVVSTSQKCPSRNDIALNDACLAMCSRFSSATGEDSEICASIAARPPGTESSSCSKRSVAASRFPIEAGSA